MSRAISPPLPGFSATPPGRARTGARCRWPLALTLWAALLALFPSAGCSDSPRGRQIYSARPDPVDPGGLLFLTGRGLADVDRAALGGRPIVIDEAEHERLRLRIPDDAPAGATWITLIAGGQPLEPFPIVIGGLNGRLDAGRRFPPRPMADAGPSPIDGGTVADAGPPDAGAPLLAEFSPDPGGDVRLEAIDSPEGQLKLRVIYPPDGSDRWGIALHLAYDRNLMRLIESTPPNSDRFATAEAGPGRTVLGGLLTEDPVVAELTFALIGRGEGRVDLPTRHRQVRGSGNRPRSEVTWAGGSVRVQEVAP